MMSSSSVSDAASEQALDKRRKVHRKVKTGCHACKGRRRKCDERKPRCTGCARFSTECVYPPSEGTCRTGLGIISSPPLQDAAATLLIGTPNVQSVLPGQGLSLNMEDLELFHQFLTSTCMPTSQRPEVTVQIQRVLPQLAQEHHFLMRGMLAQAAVHLSQLRPTQRQHYTLLAARHHSLALPEFRSTLYNLSEQNYNALIAYAFSLVWCAFARPQISSTSDSNHQPSGDITWLPEWFSLLRGSCLIIESCRAWITGGFHVVPEIDNPLQFSQSLDSRRIMDLTATLIALKETPTCRAVLSSLHYAFALASMHHHNTPLRNAMNFWIGSLPNEYITLLQNQEPWALVIMAHFAILVHRSETQWYMKGNAARLLHLIVDRLTSRWEQYVQWPREEIWNESNEVRAPPAIT